MAEGAEVAALESAGSRHGSTTVLLQGNVPLPTRLKMTGDLGENWRRWRQIWESYEIVSRLSEQSDEYRVAVFITCVGQDALEIYSALPFKEEGDKKRIQPVLALMEAYCVGDTNVIYERFQFQRRTQEPDETVEQFVTALKALATSCQFGDTQEERLRDQMVFGVRDLDNALRKQLLQRKDLNFSSCLEACRSFEATTRQMKVMSTTEKVHSVQHKEKRPPAKDKQTMKTPTKDTLRSGNCGYCGLQHKKGAANCPAYGKCCSACNKMNHYARQCRAKKKSALKTRVQELRETDSELEEDDLMTLTLTTCEEEMYVVSNTKHQKQIFATMLVKGTRIRFQIDTGATCNVVKERELPGQCEVHPTRRMLRLYNNQKLAPVGICGLELTNPRTSQVFTKEFVVVKEAETSILGAEAAQSMGLVEVRYDQISQTEMINENPESPSKGQLLREYADVFQGEIGTFQGTAHLEVDPQVPAVQTPIRKVPVAMKTRLKEELDRLEMLGVVEKLETPTDWLSALVTVKKTNGKIRICLDPKPLNKALRRSHYPVRTLDDVLQELSKARVFSTADVRNGYWHVMLDDESKQLTAFGTPYGRYCWKRLPFGLSVSPEIFQRELNHMIDGIPGIFLIADDILIIGEGETDQAAVQDHDRKLHACLQQCRRKGIKLNEDKFHLRRTTVSYMGHLLTDSGLKPDTLRRFEQLLRCPSPQM